MRNSLHSQLGDERGKAASWVEGSRDSGRSKQAQEKLLCRTAPIPSRTAATEGRIPPSWRASARAMLAGIPDSPAWIVADRARSRSDARVE